MQVQTLPPDAIDPNPDQPRKRFTDLDELARSIHDRGLLEPIMVRPIGERYQLIHGERRWRAAQLARLCEIPAIIRDVDRTEAYAIALVENVQCSNLTLLEEAQAYAVLQEQGQTQAAIGRLIGKGQSYIAHKLRLLRLPPLLITYLEAGLVTENHVR